MDFSKMDIEPIAKKEAEVSNVGVGSARPEKSNNNLLVSEEFVFEHDRTLMISCGNGGGNMLKHNVQNNICGDVENYITDTDFIALKTKDVSGANIVLFGEKECKGKGAGTHPEVAEKAALESEDKIRTIVKGAGLVFLIAGEGGGTGTGCSPVVARIAKEAGAIVVAIVTKPFKFEGKAVMNRAIEGINKLRETVDAIMVVDNQKVLSIGEANIPWVQRLRKIDDFVGGILSGFVSVTRDESIMKLDFNDIKFMFEHCKGNMYIGAGESTYTPMAEDSRDWDGGEKAMMEAVENAITSPLISGINLSNAKGVIALYSLGEDVSLEAIEKAQERVNDAIGNDCANIIFGADANEKMNGKIKVFFIIAGLSENAEIQPNVSSFMTAPRVIKQETVERIDIFAQNNEAMGEEVPVPRTPRVLQGIYGETQTISVNTDVQRVSTHITPKEEENPKGGLPTTRGTFFNTFGNNSTNIHGEETPPGFMRQQCQ